MTMFSVDMEEHQIPFWATIEINLVKMTLQVNLSGLFTAVDIRLRNDQNEVVLTDNTSVRSKEIKLVGLVPGNYAIEMDSGHHMVVKEFALKNNGV